MNAETINCQSCGAAASTDAPNCNHCGAILATVSCPSCFGMLFLGSRYCPHCGQSASRVESGTTKKLCPVCSDPLAVVQLDKLALSQCQKCHGFWLETTMLEGICRNAEQQATILTSTSVVDLTNEETELRYRRCPDCQEFMARNNFARYSGIIVDTCRQHGTWFDLHELRRVVEYIQGGGYLRGMEKERRALEYERRRLENVRDSGGSAPAYGGMSGGSMDMDDLVFYGAFKVISQIIKACD